MTETFLNLLEMFLTRRRSPRNETAKFAQWKHNEDILPRLQRQIETLLKAHNLFEPIVYDIQGILDGGRDVLIRSRLRNSDDEEFGEICFQVKSLSDLSKRDYMRELKAQRDDSFRRPKEPDYYFILLCTDSKKQKERIRMISAVFSDARKTKIIEPEYAYTFLTSAVTSIEAFVKWAMQSDDVVFLRARDSLRVPSRTARALAIFLAVQVVLTGGMQFNENAIIENGELRRIYNLLEGPAGLENVLDKADDDDEDVLVAVFDSDFEDKLTSDLALLENRLLERESGSNSIVVIAGELRALTAMITDALARYDYEEADLLSYMFSAMGVIQ